MEKVSITKDDLARVVANVTEDLVQDALKDGHAEVATMVITTVPMIGAMIMAKVFGNSDSKEVN